MMIDFITTFSQLSLVGSIAVVSIAIVRFLGRRVLNPIGIYYLWALVPMLMVIFMLLPNATPQWTGLFSTSYDLAPVAEAIGVNALETDTRMANIQAELSVRKLTGLAADFPHFFWLVSAVWMSGSVFYLATSLRAHHNFVTRVRPFKRVSICDTTIFVSQSKDFSPMLLGLLRSVIVVPSDFFTQYTLEEQKIIVTHESIHRDRHDILVNFITFILTAIFWFNPLFHWMLRELRCDQEIACDAAVMRALPISRKNYVYALLVGHGSKSQSYLACSWRRQHDLVRRCDALGRKPTLGLTSSNLLLLTVIVLFGFGAWSYRSDIREQPFIDPMLKMREVVSLADQQGTSRRLSQKFQNVSKIEISEYGGLLKITSEDRADVVLSVLSGTPTSYQNGQTLLLNNGYDEIAEECHSLALDRFHGEMGMSVTTLRVPYGVPIEIKGYVYSLIEKSDLLNLSFHGCGVAQVGEVLTDLAIRARGQHRIITDGVGGSFHTVLRGQTEILAGQIHGRTEADLRGQAKLVVREGRGEMNLATTGQSLVWVHKALGAVSKVEMQNSLIRVGN